MNLLGLGTEKDVQKAVAYFEKAKDDPQSQNALGVIYQSAPDVFENDPVKLISFGKVRKNV